MAIVAGQITVTTTAPVLIHQTDADGCDIILAADIGTNQHVVLGPPDVTVTTGLIFDGGSNLHFTMPPGSALYGISNNGTAVVSKLVSD